MGVVESSDESEYIQMSRRMSARGDRIRAGIARHDRYCWGGYVELIRFRLRSRNRCRSKAIEQIAGVVDPLVRAAAMADALECLRPLHVAGCVLADVSDVFGGHAVILDDAVLSGADRVVAWLLDQRICEPNERGSDGLTPLHLAMRRGRPSTISVLLAGGAFIDTVTCLGKTPLHFAVEHGHLPAAKQLLLAGANPGATTLNGETALMTSARKGSWDFVELLLEHGSPVLSALPDILQWWGVGKLCDPRLAHVRLDRCRRDEIGSLFSSLDPDEARLLLTRGADPSCAAEYALRHHKHKLLPMIREYGRFPYTEAHFRAAADCLLGMTQLLDDGADPNTWVSRGGEGSERVPVIHYAATEVDTDLGVILLLLERGADSSPSPASDLRPLLCELISRGRGTVSLIRALVQHGERPNARDGGGRSALHAVVEGIWNEHIAKLLHTLVELGADPNARDHHSRTPMMIAVGNPHRDLLSRVQVLLNAGADASYQDADGMSALHYFFSGDRDGDESTSLAAALELLIHNGADVNAQDVRGKYADEVGDETLSHEQRTCVRRIRLRRAWASENAILQSAVAPLLRC